MSSEPNVTRLTYKCSRCGGKVTASVHDIGQQAPCPHCGYTNRVPFPKRRTGDAIEDDGQLNMPTRSSHVNYHDHLETEARTHRDETAATEDGASSTSHPLRTALVVFNIVMVLVIVAIVVWQLTSGGGPADSP